MQNFMLNWTLFWDDDHQVASSSPFLIKIKNGMNIVMNMLSRSNNETNMKMGNIC